MASIDNDAINVEELHERDLINLIKDNMSQEKVFNSEIVMILKEQIEHMKSEITHKNTIIEGLMTELYNRNDIKFNSSHLNNEHFNEVSSTTISNHHKEDILADSLTDNQDEWQTINKSRSTIITPEVNWNIPLVNRFNGMPVDDLIDDNISETDFQRSVTNNMATIMKSV